MMYSSAIFPTTESTLLDGSIHKLDTLCRRIDLRPDDHVLEIGTGWGGFALHAARNYGCRVTTTTISDRQFDYVRDRVRVAGLEDRITVLDRDYRDLDGMKIPFRLRATSAVQSFTIAIEKIAHNITVDETMFSKPAK